MKPSRTSRHAARGTPEEDIAHDAELWNLLGKADRPTPVSPFFARNVLREIRLAEAQKAESGWAAPWRELLRRWRVVTAGLATAAVVTLAAALAVTPSHEQEITLQASYDAEIIAHLDELLDDESIWLDSTVSAY